MVSLWSDPDLNVHQKIQNCDFETEKGMKETLLLDLRIRNEI